MPSFTSCWLRPLATATSCRRSSNRTACAASPSSIRRATSSGSRSPCREHLAILDALEQGDNEWASTLLHRHLEVASKMGVARNKA
ncbi:FCD domain-containing protein [Pseudomonas sp. TH10]|uniref:FCD domain-containing protein n=1 Tax=Pseudomonas sp. TH10 TaxID=2796376 RepID=UPI0035A858A9